MGLYEFIPIENEGMSVVSALVLFFSGIGSWVIMKWIIEKFNYHDKVLTAHEKMFDEVTRELNNSKIQFTEMKGDIKQTRMIVDRIDKSLSDIAKTNTKVIESFLRKGNNE